MDDVRKSIDNKKSRNDYKPLTVDQILASKHQDPPGQLVSDMINLSQNPLEDQDDAADGGNFSAPQKMVEPAFSVIWKDEDKSLEHTNLPKITEETKSNYLSKRELEPTKDDEATVEGDKKDVDSSGSSDSSEDEGPVTFTANQLYELQQALMQIHLRHASGKSASMNMTEAIIQTSNIIVQFLSCTIGRYRELRDCCRDLFRDIIYTIRDKEANAPQFDVVSTTKSNNKSSKYTKKAPEIEVIRLSDLAFRIDD